MKTKVTMLAVIGMATVACGMVAMRSSIEVVTCRVAEARDVYSVIPRPLYAIPDEAVSTIVNPDEAETLRQARLAADVEWCRAMLASKDADVLMVKASKAGILDAASLIRDAGEKANESLAAAERCHPLYEIAKRQFDDLMTNRN